VELYVHSPMLLYGVVLRAAQGQRVTLFRFCTEVACRLSRAPEGALVSQKLPLHAMREGEVLVSLWHSLTESST
jgi:hypothetical protein